MSIRIDPYDRIVAAGYTDGGINLFDLQSCSYYNLFIIKKFKEKIVFYLAGTPELTPVTCLRWRSPNYASHAKNVLVAGNADGSISHYHASSGIILFI